MRDYLFFDLDGTLTHSMPGITRAVQYALRRYGIEVEDLNVLKPFVGPPLQESFMEYYDFTKQDADAAVHVYREYYNTEGWAENEPYEGIRELLSRLKEDGRHLVVATSKPERMALRILDHFGLSAFFERIAGATESGSRVNKDDVIRYAMEGCKVSEPDRIVMIGDRRHDIAGAHRAGVKAVGVLYGYGGREELETAGADWIAEDVSALGELLRSL